MKTFQNILLITWVVGIVTLGISGLFEASAIWCMAGMPVHILLDDMITKKELGL